MIYGGVDARGIRFEDVDEALAVPNADLRLFGKPEAYRPAADGRGARDRRRRRSRRASARKRARAVAPRAPEPDLP